jgi:hypothetical protein
MEKLRNIRENRVGLYDPSSLVLVEVMRTHWFKALLPASVVLAFVDWVIPQTRPIDFHAVLWLSLPLTCLWALMIALAAYRFGRKSLWMLVGVPLALYWPIWLLLNGIPACYWSGNWV